MALLSLCFMLAVAPLGPCHDVDARSVPDVGLFGRRAERSDPLVQSVCRDIKNSISSASAVYAPGTPEYLKDIGMESFLDRSWVQLLMYLTQQSIGSFHQPKMLRVQSNRGMCKTFLLWYMFTPRWGQRHCSLVLDVWWLRSFLDENY